MIIRKYRTSEPANHPWRVFIRLYAMSQASVVATSPREYTWYVRRARRWGLHGNYMILTTTYICQTNLTRIVEADALHFTLRVDARCHHIIPHSIAIGFALDEDGPTHEFGTVRKAKLASGNNVFASFSISQLTPLT